MCAADMPRLVPGLSFSLPSDAGFIVGLMTHDVPKVGELVWISSITYDEEPTTAVVEAIESWRWPVLFPLGAAIRRGLVHPLGTVEVPDALKSFPTMRSEPPRG